MKTARFTCYYGEFEVDYDGPHPPCTVIAKGKHGHDLLFVVSWAVIGSEVTATRVEVAEFSIGRRLP